MRRLPLAFALALCTLGCGYGFVRPDQGPVARLHVGHVDDTSAEGDLGLVAADALRAGLSGRARPTLDPAGPALGGVVRVGPARPRLYDGGGAGRSAVSQSDVTVALTLRGADGAEYWAGAPHRRTADWPRGATPVQSRDARRQALRAAVRAATGDALASFLSLPEGS